MNLLLASDYNLPFAHGWPSSGRKNKLLLLETEKKIYGICNYPLKGPKEMLKGYKIKRRFGITIFSGVK